LDLIDNFVGSTKYGRCILDRYWDRNIDNRSCNVRSCLFLDVKSGKS
jgi:hypothetical protein